MSPNADLLPLAVVILAVVLAVHLIWHHSREEHHGD
jgi:hypothetical protein